MNTRKILIVEDEPSLLHSLTFTLRRKGFEVVPAVDAEQALLILNAAGIPAAFNLIITDIQLPGMSGLAFIDHLRTIAASLKVIVITALATKSLEKELESKGVGTVLHKPFTVEELVGRVVEVVGWSETAPGEYKPD